MNAFVNLSKSILKKMAITLGNGCINCENLMLNDNCRVHGIQVSQNYTCDSFSIKASIKNNPGCDTCAKFGNSNCAHPAQAKSGVLCSSWAPEHVTA